MNGLQVIEHRNQRVLTTAQIAEGYGTNTQRISENFNRNRERYIKGVHYYTLEGDEKRRFCNHTQIADGLQNAGILYLWTEAGALLHAKSLNTDKAWEMYNHLIKTYFMAREMYAVGMPNLSSTDILELQVKGMRELEAVQKRQAQALAEVAARQDTQKAQLDTIQGAFKNRPQTAREWRRSVNDDISDSCASNGIRFDEAWKELYRELEIKAGVNLMSRRRFRQIRMREAGQKETDISKITRLWIISEDLALRSIFESIVMGWRLRFPINPVKTEQ